MSGPGKPPEGAWDVCSAEWCDHQIRGDGYCSPHCHAAELLRTFAGRQPAGSPLGDALRCYIDSVKEQWRNYMPGECSICRYANDTSEESRP